MSFARRAARIALGAAVLAAAALGTSPALACQACFSANVDSPLVDGAKMGVWLLIGVTALVQGGFVWFFIVLRQRAKRAYEAELESEWVALQRSTSRP